MRDILSKSEIFGDFYIWKFGVQFYMT